MKPPKLGPPARLTALGAVAASTAFIVASAVSLNQASADVSISFDELIFGSPGSTTQVEVVEVDPALVGMNCVLEVRSENQASVHPGNDLIVSTGNSQAVIVGVEDTANGGSTQTYDMVLGQQIVVQLRFGQDGMSSLGFGLAFECPDPTTTTTTVETTVPGPTIGGSQVVSSTTTSLVESVTSAPPASAVVTTTTASTTSSTVDGPTTGLPETPPAKAVVGVPAYTG